MQVRLAPVMAALFLWVPIACGTGGTVDSPDSGSDAGIVDGGPADPGMEEDGPASDIPFQSTWVYRDKPFLQDRTQWFSTAEGLPSNDVKAIFLGSDGKAVAATAKGLARQTDDSSFELLQCPGATDPIIDVVAAGSSVAFLSGQSLWVVTGAFSCEEIALPSPSHHLSLSSDDPFTVLVSGDAGVYGWSGGPLVTIPGTDGLASRASAAMPGNAIAVATDTCLLLVSTSDEPQKMCVEQALPSNDVRTVSWDDSGGLLWIGTALGIASWVPGDEKVTPFLGEMGGLPYDDITGIATGPSGMVAAGTPEGALRLEPDRWHYIHGRNLLPDDKVLDLAIGPDDDLWIATDMELARIQRVSTTLSEKAAFFDEATRARHNRFGMVSPCILATAGDLSTYQMRDDDNDGQWTGMYLASQSFRCAVTAAPEACDNARSSMKAMLRLEEITGVPGFFARSYVAGDMCEAMQAAGGEWHLTADGQWCWKGDTSTDEFVGHTFGLSVYHDLVATDAEKALIAAMYGRILDRIIEHGFYIADLDGLCTSDGHFDPDYINLIGQFGDAGLNSAMILGGLRFGHLITGDAKYAEAYDELVTVHGYDDNVRRMLEITHAFWINHDSHEMIFLALYPLLTYETDPDLRPGYLQGLEDIWQNQRPENNPEFNMIHAVFSATDEIDLDVTIRSLKEMPWDLVIWEVRNSHRKDYQLDPEPDRFGEPQALAVFPYDQRHVMKWNQNPYRLEGGGNGHQEETGTHWLLPYWMGRHFGFIENDVDSE